VLFFIELDVSDPKVDDALSGQSRVDRFGFPGLG
jgi:hypothetical protein